MDILQDIWIKHNNEWVLGKLKKKIENKYEVVIDDDIYIIEKIEIKNKDEEDNVDDFINIPHLNEPSILNGLRLRYMSNKIYTYTGKILISVNPFKNLNLYNNKNMNLYKNNSKINNPHIYQIPNNAYNNMINFKKNQSILVSGESGAGKTHATKMMLEYITFLSGNEKDIEEKILLSNPILEAFGNAKTIRNDNSSRFGKFIKLNFNNNKLCSSIINTYLLEKIRLIYQGMNERNFHIFYLMIKGMSDNQKEKYFINSSNYNYLKNGLIERDDNVNDKDEFNLVLKAFKKLNFTEEDIELIFSITSGILNLGNIEYDEEGEIINKEQIIIVSKLLKVDNNLLNFTLLNRNLNVSGEEYEIKLKKHECIYTRDSLSMNLYQNLFDFILNKINNSLNNSKKIDSFIGILDIFGFESIENNNFEQLCINYTNERLQNQFNKYIFLLEQEEYKKEKINWKSIKFPDNSECLKLIDGKFGILSMLDEECKLPKGSDKNFTQKLTKKYTDNIYFINNKKFNNEKICINHYAGNVIYETNNFCEKNKNIISNEINKLIEKISICKKINSNVSVLKSKSISYLFKNQLKELVKIINDTNTHYIRCIKPNDLNESDNFNKTKITHQLKYCGVLEAIKVARSGYAIKMKFNYFLNRYKMIKSCNSIDIFSKNKYLNNTDFQIGLTKVFLKTNAYEKLEKIRLIKLNEKAILIQKNIRKLIYRNKYIKIYKSIIALEGFCRIIISKNKLKLLRNIKSQIIISKNFRMYKTKKLFKLTLDKIIKIQYFYKKYKRKIIKEKCIIIQKFYKKYKNRRKLFEKNIENKIIIIQKNIRKVIYLNKFKNKIRLIKFIQRTYRKNKSSKKIIIEKNKKLKNELIEKDVKLKENENRIQNLEDKQEEMLKIIKKLENMSNNKEEVEILNNDIKQYKDCIVKSINSKASMFEELEKIKMENYLLKKKLDEKQNSRSIFNFFKI
jgi:myosin V